jgi:rhamnogalacturonyl hydrolase YesR
MLQALVSKGVLTIDEALEVVDKSLDAVLDTPDDEGVDDVIGVAHACLEHVRGKAFNRTCRPGSDRGA